MYREVVGIYLLLITMIVVTIECGIYLLFKILAVRSINNSANQISKTVDKIDHCMADIKSEIDEIHKDMQ